MTPSKTAREAAERIWRMIRDNPELCGRDAVAEVVQGAMDAAKRDWLANATDLDFQHERRMARENSAQPSALDSTGSAETQRLRDELSEWRSLLIWGGTPEAVGKFIEGQQARIHACQDYERDMESLAAERDAARAKCARQRTELRRLNRTLRSMWDGVRFSHRVDRDMTTAKELRDARARIAELEQREAERVRDLHAGPGAAD